MSRKGTLGEVVLAAVKLARWLGPLAPKEAPAGIARRTERCGPTRAYVYESGRALGVYLVLPGLHFKGPDDPRLDRFCRVLAASGFAVVAPFVRSFEDLVLHPSAFEDAEAALALARSIASGRRLGEPAVFSISFGSILALHLAASESPPRACLLFGGYADFSGSVRFALTGRTEHDGRPIEILRDPLNSPVVFLNILADLDVDQADHDRLSAAWRAMVHRTWGKMELKRSSARAPFADEIARDLPAHLAEPFRRGCGLAAGHADSAEAERAMLEWAERGLARSAASLSFFDAARLVERVRADVVLVHGRDDDVIPYSESLKLARALPPSRVRGVHITGLYGHTGASEARIAKLVDEARTMMAMLRDLASAPIRGVG